MNPIKFAPVALALAVLWAGGAQARGRAEAALGAPTGRPVNTLIESERWRCDGAACRGPINVLPGAAALNGPLGVSVCRQIAQRSGRVEAMRMGGAVMSPAALALCNGDAALATTRIASRR